MTGTQGSELAITSEQSRFTDRQVATLRQIGLQGATEADLEVFFHHCQRTGLDPFARQIYMIERFQNGRKLWTIQTGIDGFRLIARRATDAARGTLGYESTQWCGTDGVWRDVWLSERPPSAARVTVLRDGHPFPAVALFAEYAGRKRDGSLSSMWETKGALMLGKCFDSATEVLTTNGFERFDSVTGLVMQVTERGVEPCDAQPFWQPYGGPMIQLDSNDLNFCVTPNHDMVTTSGRIEAGTMFNQARSRAKFHIPRSVQGTKAGTAMSDDMLRLAAAYVCDGYDRSNGFTVSVARPRKVEMLRSLRLHRRETAREMSEVVAPSGRTITPTLERHNFEFDPVLVSDLVGVGKVINVGTLLSLSRDQARIFVDAMVAFDGHQQHDTGVRRFYTSRLDHLAAFEVAAVAAGYAVSQRRSRTSDLSDQPNYYVTISERDAIPVVRWGRTYQGHGGNSAGRTGLESVQADGKGVWCVTVPSGEIIVRRHGFSMRCGNCAEALALRKAFPIDLSGLYTAEEMHQADQSRVTVTQSRPTVAPAPASVDAAMEALRGMAEPMLSADQTRTIGGLVKEAGLNKQDALEFAVEVVGHPLTSATDLTETEAAAVIAALTELVAAEAAVAESLADPDTGEVYEAELVPDAEQEATA